jgi:hypothetical protein
MAGYSVGFASSSTGSGASYTTTFATTLALRAGSYAIQIVKVEATASVYQVPGGTVAAGGIIPFYTYSSSVISSGAGTLTPQAMREGAAAASATARYSTAAVNYTTPSYTPGTAVGITGTQKFLAISVSPVVYQPAFNVILAPGSVFHVAQASDSSVHTVYSSIIVYFDELHLARSN